MTSENNSDPQWKAVTSRFYTGLETLLTETVLEDGCSHPAEQFVADFLKQYRILGPAYLRSYILREREGRRSAEALTLLGRIPQALIGNLGYDIVSNALQSANIRIRDAAIKALEQWGGERALEILEKHHEPVDWLAEYKSRVITDLKNCSC